MYSRPLFAALLATAALLGSSPLYAQEAFYQDHPARGLKFADMEFAMPTDPLLPSWVGISHVIHTPAQYLADATGQLRTAVPAGTAASAAAAVLTKAGARCDVSGGDALTCHYRDVETPRGEYFDAINWTVTMPLASGRVTDVAVTRDWVRR